MPNRHGVVNERVFYARHRCRGVPVLRLSGRRPIAYPAKPVRVLLGFPPGAGVDITTRLVTSKMSESLGRQFVVDNRAGAAGNIAVEVAARAAPDGYTLLGMTAAAAVSQSAYAKPPYDLARDFVPIALMASAPFGLAVHPSVPAKSLKELIALAKAKPGQLSYSTPGTASSPHLTAELLKQQTGIDILHVPYKGTVPAITDTIAGNVSMTFAQTLTLLPPITVRTPARHRDREREAQQRRARPADVHRAGPAGLRIRDVVRA